MPIGLLKQQYQSLHKLIGHYRSAKLNGDIVQQTLNLCNQLQLLAKAHPNLLFAQIHLPKSTLPPGYNQLFSCCLLTALICTRNRFNETTTQQLMCATVSLLAFEQENSKDSIHKTPPKPVLNRAFCRILTQYQQAVWLRAYSALAGQHQRTLGSDNLDVTCVTMAVKLSQLLHSNPHSKKLNFHEALQAMVRKSNNIEAQLLAPLTSFPGVIPPGCYILLDDDSIAIVVAILAEKLVCVGQSTPQRQAPNTGHFRVSTSRVKRIYPAQALKQLTKLEAWWGAPWVDYQSQTQLALLTPFNQSFRINQPPATLTAIQGQLNKPVQDAKALSEAISYEPAFAQHLRSTASQSSRQKLPIKAIRHGLMMHGFERSGAIIMQQALLSRLNQHYFPLQRAFIQFAQLRGHLAASIAKAAEVGIPEQACTLSYFATVGLFTHPQLKMQVRWQRTSTCTFDITSVIRCIKPLQLRSHAVSLAEAWQQPRHEISALKNYHDVGYIQGSKNSAPVKAAAILGLSLMISRALYFSEKTTCPQSQLYYQYGGRQLGLSSDELQSIAQDAFAVCHSYSPV